MHPPWYICCRANITHIYGIQGFRVAFPLHQVMRHPLPSENHTYMTFQARLWQIKVLKTFQVAPDVRGPFGPGLGVVAGRAVHAPVIPGRGLGV